MESMVVAVVFWAGRPSLPAMRRPIPQPTAVCVIAKRLVCTGSDDFDMMLGNMQRACQKETGKH